MKSTMGAPLSDAEEARIIMSWDLLMSETAYLRSVTDPAMALERIAEFIGHCHAFQRTVHECWSSANRRQFVTKKPATVASVLTDLQGILDFINRKESLK